jgi:hypothetical protein
MYNSFYMNNVRVIDLHTGYIIQSGLIIAAYLLDCVVLIYVLIIIVDDFSGDWSIRLDSDTVVGNLVVVNCKPGRLRWKASMVTKRVLLLVINTALLYQSISALNGLHVSNQPFWNAPAHARYRRHYSHKYYFSSVVAHIKAYVHSTSSNFKEAPNVFFNNANLFQHETTALCWEVCINKLAFFLLSSSTLLPRVFGHKGSDML